MGELSKPIPGALGGTPPQTTHGSDVTFEGGGNFHLQLPTPVTPSGRGGGFDLNAQLHLDVENFFGLGVGGQFDKATEKELDRSFWYKKGFLNITRGRQSPSFLDAKTGREEITSTAAQHLQIGFGSSDGTSTFELGSVTSQTYTLRGEKVGGAARFYIGNQCGLPTDEDPLNPPSVLSLHAGISLRLSGLDQSTTPAPKGLHPLDIAYAIVGGAHRLFRSYCSAQAIASQSKILQDELDALDDPDEYTVIGEEKEEPAMPATRLEGTGPLVAVNAALGSSEDTQELSIFLNAVGEEIGLLVGGKIVSGVIGNFILNASDASPTMMTQGFASLESLADFGIGYGMDLNLSSRRLLTPGSRKEKAIHYFLARAGTKLPLFALGWAFKEEKAGQAAVQAAQQGMLSNSGNPDSLETGTRDSTSHLFRYHWDHVDGTYFGYLRRSHLREANLYSDITVLMQTSPSNGPVQENIVDPITDRDPAREPARAMTAASIGFEWQPDPLLLSVGARTLLHYGASSEPRPGVGLEQAALFSAGNESVKGDFGMALSEDIIDGDFHFGISGVAGLRF